MNKDTETVESPPLRHVIGKKAYSLDMIPESPVSAEHDVENDKKFKDETTISLSAEKIW